MSKVSIMEFNDNKPQIAVYLDALGWSPRFLADRLGVNERGVYRWLNGQNETPERILNWLKMLSEFQKAHDLPDGWVSEKP